MKGLLVVIGLFAFAAIVGDLDDARRDLERARRELARLRALAGVGAAP